MSRKNDDDIAVYDPYVQSLRKSHVVALRKYLAVAIPMTSGNEGCLDGMTDDDIEAFQKVVEAVNRKEKA